MSLANKYTPKTFQDFLGQHVAIKTLKGQLNNPSGGYLFQGNTGTGKTTLAKVFLETVGVHPSCIEYINSGNYGGIDYMRSLTSSKWSQKPLKGAYKAFVLEEAHRITSATQNELLTPLDCIPEHIIFIMITTQPEKLIKDLHRRLLPIYLKDVPNAVISDFLCSVAEKEDKEFKKSFLRRLAGDCSGSPGMALKYLEGALYLSEEDLNEMHLHDESEETLGALYKAIISKNWKGAFDIVDTYKNNGVQADVLRNSLYNYVIAVLKKGPKEDIVHTAIILEEPLVFDGYGPLIARLARINSMLSKA